MFKVQEIRLQQGGWQSETTCARGASKLISLPCVTAAGPAGRAGAATEGGSAKRAPEAQGSATKPGCGTHPVGMGSL